MQTNLVAGCSWRTTSVTRLRPVCLRLQLTQSAGTTRYKALIENAQVSILTSGLPVCCKTIHTTASELKPHNMAAEELDQYVVAQQMFKDQPPGFPFEGFDLEELILPDGDDMGFRSDDDDIDEEEIETETGFGSVIGKA